MNELPHLSIRQITANRPLFVTRWWGFRPDTWGAVMFGDESIVNRWIRDCPTGGFVLGFASHNAKEEVDPQDRGRVLGLYEFVPIKVTCEDPEVIAPSWLEDRRLYNSSGRFRWPYGLKAIRAWRFFQPNVMTAGTLPDARSIGFLITKDMAPLTEQDLLYVDQYPMIEVRVYQRPFEPLRLTEPNARPDQNYLLVCRDVTILRRIPEWQEGEILYKPGIASDSNARLDSHNNHALARLFGLALCSEWTSPAYSTEVAREREQRMIEFGEAHCRPAAQGQREFFLGPPTALIEFIAAGGGVKRVT